MTASTASPRTEPVRALRGRVRFSLGALGALTACALSLVLACTPKGHERRPHGEGRAHHDGEGEGDAEGSDQDMRKGDVIELV